VSRAAAVALVVLAACKDAPAPPEVVHVPADLVVPAGAATARSCPPTDVETFDVRREPRALASDGSYIYWVDDGDFVEEPELHFVHDGTLWRRAVGGGAPEALYDHFGVARGLALVGDVALVSESSKNDVAHPGIAVISRTGAPPNWRLAGTAIETLIASGDDVFAVKEAPKDGAQTTWHVPANGTETMIDARVGYVESIAVAGDRVIIGGSVDGNDLRGGLVVVAPEHGRRRWRIEIPRWVHSVAGDGDSVLIAADQQLLRVERRGAASVLGVAQGDIENLVVRDRYVYWLATESKAGFAIRATPLDGGATVEILRRDQMFSHHFTLDGSYVWWVESDPVSTPWSHERTQYRIGRAKLTLC
jgi:hypothetical protein